MPKIPPEYHLNTIGGQNLEDLPLKPEAESDAELRLKSLEKSGMNADQIAELTWLTRQELFGMLKEALPEVQSVAGAQPALPDIPDLDLGGQGDFKQAPAETPWVFQERNEKIKTLLKQDKFQKKIAYYKKLLQKSGNKMQQELARHQQEKDSINGFYHHYQRLAHIKADLEGKLSQTMAQLFAQRGKDPDSMLVDTRAMLEEGIATAVQQMDKLKEEKPDVAALLEYDKIKSYSEQLEKTDFVWTESRKELLNEALNKVVAGRPMVILMGESGTGKTAMAHALAKELTGKEALRELGGSESRFKDSLAARAIDEKGSFYDFGPILQAMTGMNSSRDKKPRHEGAVYFDDEFNTRPAGVQRQILKFIADAKPGRQLTVPGTDLKVTVQPKFLYVAAGNPPSARYEREETPVEAYREVAGIVDVDYLDQTKDRPELLELMAAALMDQKTRRLRLVSEEELKPAFVKDAASGKEVVDENPESGGFLYRFAYAWSQTLYAFSHKENVLTEANPSDPPEKYYLQKFILDVGKVRGWLSEFKASRRDQQNGIEDFLLMKLRDELNSYPKEDVATVDAFFRYFGIQLSGFVENPEREVRPEPFKIMTPKETGYLFSNVPRPQGKAEVPSPKGKIAILRDGSEVEYEETLPQGMAHIGKVGDEIRYKKGKKLYRVLGQTASGYIVLESRNICTVWKLDDVLQHFDEVMPLQPRTFAEFKNYISKLSLTPKQQEQLVMMMNGYGLSFLVAKEVDPAVSMKPFEEVIAAFLKLGIDKIKEIANFGQPTLVVTPKNSFADKLANMNQHKYYSDANGSQDDAFVWNDANGPYKNIGTPDKTVVSVVDGQPHMPHIPGIASNSRFDQRKAAFKDYFAQKGMRLINIHEAAVLEQRSLCDYQNRANDVSKIVDYYYTGAAGGDTVSCLDDEYLTNSSFVAFSYFNEESRKVDFHGDRPVTTAEDLRGRPSVPFLEYSDEEVEQQELFKKLEASYDEMKATLVDFGFTQAPPSKTQVMDAMKKLSPDKLKEIAKFGKPTVLITPRGLFSTKLEAINNHKKMPGQIDTYCEPKPNDQLWVGGSAKMVVTVVDGLDAMPQPSFITNDLNVGQKMEKYEEDFEDRKVDMMTSAEGAMLMMQSLKRGQPVDDLNSTQTVTYFNRAYLTKGSVVPYGCWNSNFHQVNFSSRAPDHKDDALRCRPSVRVLEI